MASGIGLTSRLLTGEESTYGTAAASIDRTIEFDGEGFDDKKEVLVSNSLGTGNVSLRRGSRRVVAARWAEGSVDLEVTKNGFGRWLKHTMGGTPTIVQQGATIAYLQTHALGSVLGKSLTVQKQVRDESGTLKQQFTATGTKILSAEFKIDKKGKLMASLGMDSKALDVTTAAATPTNINTSVFHFAQAALTIGGVSATLVSAASLKFDRKLDTDRFFFGSAGRKSEPTINDFPDLSGSLTAEFDVKATFFDRFVADSPHALVLTFTGDLIASTFFEEIKFTIPEVRFVGDVTPKINGPGIILENVGFEGQNDGSAAGMTVTYMSSDATIL